jgi:hypothetical protein
MGCRFEWSDSRGWSAEAMQRGVNACLAGLGKDLTDADPVGSRGACECVVKAAHDRWTYVEFRERITTFSQELEAAGIVSECRRQHLASPQPSKGVQS